LTDKENVMAVYPSAHCTTEADTIQIYGRLMYYVRRVRIRYDGAPIMHYMTMADSEELAWSIAWRDVQHEMLEKLENA